MEKGSVGFFNDKGEPLLVNMTGGAQNPASVLSYNIPPAGLMTLVSDGLSQIANAGWIQVTPDSGTTAPVGGGVFSFAPAGTLVTESGVPSAVPTTHARIYVDRSNGHSVGLALTSSLATSITVRAFRLDGTTPAGTATLNLAANGHVATFDYMLIPSLGAGFVGVLDITAQSPFSALTLRSLMNSRREFLMATFPVADFDHPAPLPIVFPHIADGEGYQTEFIQLSGGTGGGAALRFFDNNGLAFNIGRR